MPGIYIISDLPRTKQAAKPWTLVDQLSVVISNASAIIPRSACSADGVAAAEGAAGAELDLDIPLPPAPPPLPTCCGVGGTSSEYPLARPPSIVLSLSIFGLLCVGSPNALNSYLLQLIWYVLGQFRAASNSDCGQSRAGESARTRGLCLSLF